MKIDDGKGKNGQMSVSVAQRGNVSAKTAHRIFYVSRDSGLAFNAIYEDITAAAGDVVAYLKNTSPSRNLFVKHIEFHSAENVKWKIHHVSGVAASGTVITPVNIDLASGRPAEATAMSGDTSITGLTNIAQLGSHRSQAAGDSYMDFEGALLLGPQDAVSVEYASGTTGLCSNDIFFWFEDLDHA